MDKETNEIIKEIFKMYESMALDSNVLALIKVLKKWYFEKEDYKERIDKALEYIEKELLPYGDEWCWDDSSVRDYVEEVIKILRGKE